MRIVAVDLGDVRTGLAAGDDVVRIVQPLKVVEERDPARRLERVADEIDRHGADRIVVGLPLNMDGTEGEAAVAARRFGEALAGRIGVPVDYQDERLTSFDADERLKGSGLTRRGKKKVQDSIAAATILEDWLGR
ncbi:MAG: Holliday junction resolvase RuvX [Planctomycetota bacterium]|nr:Holliday junction resolvase RuvX [Planctomycetota bacterium]MEE2894868.1 Holliday junction resolvase RuvX [Planctomycetota bacterium]